MNIDWGALGLVSVVTLFATVLVVTVASSAAYLLDKSRTRTQAGQSATALKISARALLAVLVAMIGFGLWLIIPYLH